jgi:hypothetical protein
MADNHDFLEPLSAPTGTVIRTVRAIDIAGVLHPIAILRDPSTGNALIGQQLRSASLPVALSSEDTQVLSDILSALGVTLDVDVLTLPDVDLSADALQGALSSIEITLSATVGTVTTVTLPDTARGFNLYARANPARFAINEDPAAVGTSSSTTIAASAFTVGGIAKADQWTTRLIAAGTNRTLRLRSLTASLVLDLEVF